MPIAHITTSRVVNRASRGVLQAQGAYRTAYLSSMAPVHWANMFHSSATSDSKEAAPKESSSSSRPAHKPSNLVMQIILPRSLVTEHGWPVGPLMAQSAHAATAVLHTYRDRPEVQEYLEHLEGMRKTVMEVPDEAALGSLAAKLDELDPKIPYYLWIEQPENVPTALALLPNKRPKALKSLLDSSNCTLWK